MNKFKKVALITSFAAFSSLGATTVYATQYNTNGGTWSYGKSTFGSYSNYHHPRYNHGAKVVNRSNGATSTARGGAGVWAKASIGNLWDPSNYYYKPYGFY